jgi:hypothetical protein
MDGHYRETKKAVFILSSLIIAVTLLCDVGDREGGDEDSAEDGVCVLCLHMDPELRSDFER